MQYKWQFVFSAIIWTTLTAVGSDFKWQTDAGDGNWSDAAKWTPNGVPGINDQAAFTLSQTAPFTISFTNDAAAQLLLGGADAIQPVVATFDLNGHTLTHTNSYLYAYRALEWTILDGTLWSHPTATALRIGDDSNLYSPKVTIGSGATYLHNGTTYISVGHHSSGELVIQDGGRLITEASVGTYGLYLGTGHFTGGANYTATMTVTGAGSLWSNRVGRIQLAGDALSTTELNVTDNGQLVHTGDLLLVANTVGANASLNITSGGVVDGRQASNYMSIGNNGTGTVTVAGSGSMLLPCLIKDLYLGNIADSSQGTLIIENGGLVEKMEGAHILRIANRANTTGRLIIREGGLLRWAGGQGHVYVGADKSADTISEMTVTGADSRAILGEFLIAQNGGNALLTVADGGTIELFRTMYLGRISTNSVVSHNGLGQLVVTGPGSVIKKSALTTTELPGASISGTASLGVGGGGFSGWDDNGLKYYGSYGPGGKGLAVIENGGLVDLNGAIGVYSDSTLRIDGGHTQSSTIGLETNSVFNAVLRQEDANGTALMTASGEVRIWGATLAVECGSDFTPVAGDVYTLITAGSLNSTINRFSYDGRVLQDGDLIKSGGTTFKVGYTANSVTLTVHCAGTVILVL